MERIERIGPEPVPAAVGPLRRLTDRERERDGRRRRPRPAPPATRPPEPEPGEGHVDVRA